MFLVVEDGDLVVASHQGLEDDTHFWIGLYLASDFLSIGRNQRDVQLVQLVGEGMAVLVLRLECKFSDRFSWNRIPVGTAEDVGATSRFGSLRLLLLLLWGRCAADVEVEGRIQDVLVVVQHRHLVHSRPILFEDDVERAVTIVSHLSRAVSLSSRRLYLDTEVVRRVLVGDSRSIFLLSRHFEPRQLFLRLLCLLWLLLRLLLWGGCAADVDVEGAALNMFIVIFNSYLIVSRCSRGKENAIGIILLIFKELISKKM